MHKLNALILSTVLLLMWGCEDKNTSNHSIPVENTTEVLTQTHNDSTQDTNRFKIQKYDTQHTPSIVNSTLFDTFELSNIQNKTYTVTVSNQKVTYKESTEAIVLITFFASWCPPCMHDIPSMNDLHKKYQKEMLLTAVLVQDAMPKEKLSSFLAKHDITYFVSNSRDNNDFASLVAKTLHLPKDFSIPLTVMYVEGNYFTHYEGCVPVEMIDYDIQQALKMLQ